MDSDFSLKVKGKLQINQEKANKLF